MKLWKNKAACISRRFFNEEVNAINDMEMLGMDDFQFVSLAPLALARDGLPDADLVGLMTGEMTINTARKKLRLAPLAREAADKLFVVYPDGIRPGLSRSVLREVSKRIANGETKALCRCRDMLAKTSPEMFSTLMKNCADDFIESDASDTVCFGG